MDSSNNWTKVRFFRNKHVKFGQALYVCGNIPALGDWDPRRAFKLTWTPGDNWVGDIYVQAPCDFEYKYIVADFNELEAKEVIWDEGPNAKMSIPPKNINSNSKKTISSDIRVMSFNIRFANPVDGPNFWDNRKELVANVIKKYGCDFIGLQEALFHQIADLQNMLPMYKWYGRGREVGSDEGEAVPIFYLHDKWEIEEASTFWLSDTPEVAGSKTYGNSLPRICTWARFVNKYTGTKFYVYNCHLDHQNQNSQKKSAIQIKKHMDDNCGNDKNLVLMGDFNVTDEDEAVSLLIHKGIKLKDTCNLSPKESRGTFHYWTGNQDGIKIDYILIPQELKLKEYAIIRDNFKNRYPSDHFPIVAQFIPQE